MDTYKLLEAINSEQRAIIIKQSAIIDELFSMLCRYADKEEISNMEPVLTSMKNAAERIDQCNL